MTVTLARLDIEFPTDDDVSGQRKVFIRSHTGQAVHGPPLSFTDVDFYVNVNNKILYLTIERTRLDISGFNQKGHSYLDALGFIEIAENGSGLKSPLMFSINKCRPLLQDGKVLLIVDVTVLGASFFKNDP